MYEELDGKSGAYWTHNTLARLKLHGLSLYRDYVQNHFYALVKEVEKYFDKGKEPGEPEEAGTSSLLQDEQIRSMVLHLGQVIRKYLPPEGRSIIIEKFNNAIAQYSDFASIFSFTVELYMLKFTKSDSSDWDINNIIPPEFLTSSVSNLTFPDVPNNPTSDDPKRY